MLEEEIVLCGASCYNKKFYLNDQFESLPQDVKDELKIMCVLHTEEVGGTIQIYFTEEGELLIKTDAKEEDLLYDDIGSGLKVKQYQKEKAELFEALETYYRVFFLGEEA